jgi:phosphoglycolate phosphatase
MIGDTTYDLEMAHSAGVRAIGVSWGHHSVERLREWAPVVHSVEELGPALGL